MTIGTPPGSGTPPRPARYTPPQDQVHPPDTGTPPGHSETPPQDQVTHPLGPGTILPRPGTLPPWHRACKEDTSQRASRYLHPTGMQSCVIVISLTMSQNFPEYHAKSLADHTDHLLCIIPFS